MGHPCHSVSVAARRQLCRMDSLLRGMKPGLPDCPASVFACQGIAEALSYGLLTGWAFRLFQAL